MKFTYSCQLTANPIKILAAFFNLKIDFEESKCGCTVPTLVDGEVTVRYMPAILRYIGVKSHCGCYYDRNIAQKANVDSWLDAVQSLANKSCNLIAICKDEKIFSEAAAKNALDQVEKCLTWISDYLAMHTFLVDERISIADVYLVSLLKCYINRYVQKSDKKLIHLMRYAQTVAAVGPIASIIGAFEYATAAFPCALIVTAPVVAAAAPAAKVAKYTYSTDLNAWKRFYKNLKWDQGEDFSDNFWNNVYKPEELSLWLMVYKFPENFLEDWKTKNLITVLVQRLRGEKAERDSFANMIVVKNEAESHFQVIGVVLMPKNDDVVIPEWSECSGIASFDWIRIEDTEKPEVREFIHRVWCWDEEKDMVYHGVNYGKCADGNGETFV
ncbi:Elongation factor 1-gamma [Spironucleus salmonicida]|uniref:Elongation factor 1-gamma n=1 Tax=Spironucleus salmonicida TaxID=348837 RepID=V6LQ48_9EUKA|nr:Elongation factor 1-gamma [Spironucleus salmonicida]|eukprot:EST45836.1 Elongation factor 1-gamma [Spironucleus salmonicida]